MNHERKKNNVLKQNGNPQLTENEYHILREKGTERTTYREIPICILKPVPMFVKAVGHNFFHSDSKFDALADGHHLTTQLKAPLAIIKTLL